MVNQLKYPFNCYLVLGVNYSIAITQLKGKNCYQAEMFVIPLQTCRYFHLVRCSSAMVRWHLLGAVLSWRAAGIEVSQSEWDDAWLSRAVPLHTQLATLIARNLHKSTLNYYKPPKNLDTVIHLINLTLWIFLKTFHALVPRVASFHRFPWLHGASGNDARKGRVSEVFHSLVWPVPDHETCLGRLDGGGAWGCLKTCCLSSGCLKLGPSNSAQSICTEKAWMPRALCSFVVRQCIRASLPTTYKA